MPKSPKLASKLKKSGARIAKPKREPLWKGPEVDGVTQSLLSLFLVCRERFRVKVIEGLGFDEGFSHALEYGQMWHLCEEHFARGEDWELPLKNYCRSLCTKYQLSQSSVVKYYECCRRQFPVYVEFWEKHPDVKARKPLMQEVSFSVPIVLPGSGRTVRLRGKWDSVDLIGKGKAAGIWLQENKTKGDIKEGQIQNQLQFDLQTMLYLVALEQHLGSDDIAFETDFRRVPIRGVRYNVIRRPLSGGKGSIRQHKPSKSNPAGESSESYYNRLAEYFTDDPAYWFMRWQANISTEDIERFKIRCLYPILENLCDWWEWITSDSCNIETAMRGIHWVHPFGVYNVLNEGGCTDLDNYVMTGNRVGLVEVDNLFPELN